MERTMFFNAPPEIFRKAEELRKHMTHAEILLWNYLKQKPNGHKFRRQHPIKYYIADFYCHSLRLIIEVDGSIHKLAEVWEHDIERQKYIEDEGIHFLRFTNEQIEQNLEPVIAVINDYIVSNSHK